MNLISVSVKAKFHYAIWFEPDSIMEFGFELASIMDFGFYSFNAEVSFIT